MYDSLYMKKKRHQQEVMEKALAMIASENNWEVKEIIISEGYYRTIYKIPPHEQVKV